MFENFIFEVFRHLLMLECALCCRRCDWVHRGTGWDLSWIAIPRWFPSGAYLYGWSTLLQPIEPGLNSRGWNCIITDKSCSSGRCLSQNLWQSCSDFWWFDLGIEFIIHINSIFGGRVRAQINLLKFFSWN